MEANICKEAVVTNGMSDRQIRALYCLNTLQLMAMQRQTVNYDTLAIMLGLPSRGNALASAISPVLYDVYNFCKANNFPHLTVLVVRKTGKDRGLPGAGFWKVHVGDLPDFATRVTLTEELTAQCFKVFGTLGSTVTQ
jgi:hypothetical protein